jgi:hypothetical protein
VFNRNGRLNKRGEGLVQIEVRQGRKRIYFSTCIYLKPEQFCNGLVVSHENANKLNVTLVYLKRKLEDIELDNILQGKYLTLSQFKECCCQFVIGRWCSNIHN